MNALYFGRFLFYIEGLDCVLQETDFFSPNVADVSFLAIIKVFLFNFFG